MTTVRIRKTAGNVSGIEISGHSGYAAEGEDIVCAAVTSAVRYAEVLLNDILGLDIPFRIDSGSTCISFSVPSPPPTGESDSLLQSVFMGFVRYMEQLSAEYPDHIKVTEVQHNA